MNTQKIRQVAKATRHHQKTPFTSKKEISAGGKFKKIRQRVFLVGRSGRVRPQALGLSLHGSAAITLEIGSRFFVERSQIRELRAANQKAARMGDRMDFFSILAVLSEADSKKYKNLVEYIRSVSIELS